MEKKQKKISFLPLSSLLLTQEGKKLFMEWLFSIDDLGTMENRQKIKYPQDWIQETGSTSIVFRDGEFYAVEQLAYEFEEFYLKHIK